MIDLALTIFIMSLVCCGAHVVINDDWIGDVVYKKQWWMKPLWTCCRCMASVWGGLTFIILRGIPEYKFMQIDGIDIMILSIIATAFLNSVFINYYYSKG